MMTERQGVCEIVRSEEMWALKVWGILDKYFGNLRLWESITLYFPLRVCETAYSEKLEYWPSACIALQKADLSTSIDVCRCVLHSVSCTRCTPASAAWGRRERQQFAARWTGHTRANDRVHCSRPASRVRSVSVPCGTSSCLCRRPPDVVVVPQGRDEALSIDDSRQCSDSHSHPSH